MNVLLFGATGMVGQGVLRECLNDPGVQKVLAIGRSATAQQHTKLTERIHGNLLDLSSVETGLSGFDACFFCLGVSSSGMTEEAYRRVTYSVAVSAGIVLSRLNPGMTFIYVSGQGTDSTASGRSMWARVKGETENALLALPFKAAYMFRPGIIQPLHGIVSKTRSYRVLYQILGPLLPSLKRIFPQSITTTEQLGLAMLKVARNGYPKNILETRDINSV